MVDRNKLQAEVDKNYEAFQNKLPDLARTHPGKFALMRHESVVEIFDSARDAKIFADAQFKDGLYSIQEIVDKIVDLGFFSHAVHVNPLSSDGRTSS